MKKINLFEKALENEGRNLNELGVNQTLYWAYRDSLEAGNKLLDIHETIWDKDIEEIARELKENGIEEFTISNTSTGLIQTIAEFEKHGYRLAGLAEAKEKYPDWATGEHKSIPALKLQSI